MKTTTQKLNIPLVAALSLLTCFLMITYISRGQEAVITHSDGKTKDHIIVSQEKGVWKHSKSTGLNNFNIEYKGSIEITDDDKDISHISPGGYLEISKTTFGSKRQLIIEAYSNGLRRKYYEGRQEVAYEPEGKKWLAEILPDIVRSTGIAAESRVNRYFQQGGVGAVLNEIGRLEGSYVKAIYGKLLLNKRGLSKSDLIRAVKGLGNEISSDYYLASVLKESSDKFLNDDETAEAYFATVSEISSDYYAASVLKSALEDHQPSQKSLARIMEASKNIGSDYYQSTVLAEVMENQHLEEEVLTEIISTSKNISSDYYQSQILKRALEKENLSPQAFNTLMEAVADVSSDYYMATVFSNMADAKLDEGVQINMIRLLNDKMSSDYYRASVLGKMMERQHEMSARTMDEMAKAIGSMHSSNYAASIIKKAADAELSNDAVLNLLKAIDSIDSDYYKSSALQAIAPRVKSGSGELKEAYRSTVKGIRSDTYYGRAMRAIE